jgi:gliding motility-associated-like protein
VSVEKVGGENYLPPLGFLGPDTTLCHTQKLSVIIPFKEGLVNWLGYTDTSRSISINKSGEYIATITVGGCEITDTLRVSIVPNLILPADTILCQINTPFKLSIPAGVGKLHWDDGTDDSIREITQTGLYWLTAIEKQCVQTDSIKVQIVNCPDEVPNVITPNGDGKNDTFFVKNIDIIPWELTIYDRWGSLIYQVSHYNNDWAPVGNAPGFYYYLLRENRTKKTFKGWIQVLR